MLPNIVVQDSPVQVRPVVLVEVVYVDSHQQHDGTLVRSEECTITI